MSRKICPRQVALRWEWVKLKLGSGRMQMRAGPQVRPQHKLCRKSLLMIQWSRCAVRTPRRAPHASKQPINSSALLSLFRGRAQEHGNSLRNPRTRKIAAFLVKEDRRKLEYLSRVILQVPHHPPNPRGSCLFSRWFV